MKLIREEIESVDVIVESKVEKNPFTSKVYFYKGIKNRNGRMYPVETLKEVHRYNENFTGKGRALGELGHPDGPTVNLDRVSHKITMLTKEVITSTEKQNPFYSHG